MTELQRSVLAQTYINKHYKNKETYRWWAYEKLIMVGGSIVDRDDYMRMKHDFGISGVISVESERAIHWGVPYTVCGHFPAPYFDESPSESHWHKLLTRARELMYSGNPLYVHCQQGGNRSPVVAYALMRTFYGLSPHDALSNIRKFKHDYGMNHYHVLYLESAEAAIRTFEGMKK